MKKILIAGGITIALSAGGYLGLRDFGLLASQGSVSDLIAHFQSVGLSVTVEQPTQEERSAMNEFDAILKSWPGSADVKTYDGGNLMVGSVPIDVDFFKDKGSALKYYDYFSEAEKRKERYDQEDGVIHKKKEYVLNGKYVMRISYYSVSIKNGKFDVKLLELDPKEVEAVKNAFLSFR